MIFSFCGVARAASTDLAWLFAKHPENSNEFTWDKRAPGLLRQLLPSVKLKAKAAPDLAGVVRLDIMLPEPKRIVDGRYVVFTGAMPHNATTRGLLWIDTQEKVAAFAVNECLSKALNDCFTIGAKTFAPNALPAAFLKEFKQWMNGDTGLPIQFIDGKGQESKYTLQ